MKTNSKCMLCGSHDNTMKHHVDEIEEIIIVCSRCSRCLKEYSDLLYKYGYVVEK